MLDTLFLNLQCVLSLNVTRAFDRQVRGETDGREKADEPLGPSSSLGGASLGGSGMLQSVPAQVVSQVHVPSLLHTWQGEEHSAWGAALTARAQDG